jgi:hypothetical protein
MRGRVMLRVLRGPRFRSGPFYELSISWFSGFYQGSNIEPWQRISLEFQLHACKPYSLPFVLPSLNFKPCSKHVGDG